MANFVLKPFIPAKPMALVRPTLVKSMPVTLVSFPFPSPTKTSTSVLTSSTTITVSSPIGTPVDVPASAEVEDADVFISDMIWDLTTRNATGSNPAYVIPDGETPSTLWATLDVPAAYSSSLLGNLPMPANYADLGIEMKESALADLERWEQLADRQGQYGMWSKYRHADGIASEVRYVLRQFLEEKPDVLPVPGQLQLARAVLLLQAMRLGFLEEALLTAVEYDALGYNEPEDDDDCDKPDYGGHGEGGHGSQGNCGHHYGKMQARPEDVRRVLVDAALDAAKWDGILDRQLAEAVEAPEARWAEFFGATYQHRKMYIYCTYLKEEHPDAYDEDWEGCPSDGFTPEDILAMEL